MSETTHTAIVAAMDSCRNGDDIVIDLPSGEISITAEQNGDTYTYTATLSDDSTTEVEGIAVWKHISDHEYRVE